MIQQFLKIAGVNNEKDFYKMYPNKEAFMTAHPEARALEAVHHYKKMQAGGGIYAYQNGGGNYIPNVPLTNRPDQPDNMFSPGATPWIAPVIPGAGQQTSGKPVYRGSSIADWFAAHPELGGSSLAARKKYFGPGYTGGPKENLANLETMRAMYGEDPGNEIGVTNPNTHTVTKKKAPIQPNQSFVSGITGHPSYHHGSWDVGDGNYMDPSVGTGVIPTVPVPDIKPIDPIINHIKNSKGGIHDGDRTILALGALATTGAITLYDIYQTLQAVEDAKWSGPAKTKLTKAINQLKTKVLSGTSDNIKKQATLFEKLPKKAQKIALNQQGIGDPFSAENETHALTQVGDNRARLVESAFNEADVDIQDLLSHYGKNEMPGKQNIPIRRTELRSQSAYGLPTGPTGLTENKTKIKKPNVSSNNLSWLERAADKIESPNLTKNIGKGIAKFLSHLTPREDGGETDSGTYSAGNYYQDGGDANGQQMMQKVAAMLQQGTDPKQVLQQLVQAHIPQAKAIKLIQYVMQQLQQQDQQQAPQGQPDLAQAAYGGNFYNFSGTPQYAVGGEYDVQPHDIQALLAQGYKIEYL